MKKTFLTIVGFGFSILSCINKEKIIVENTSDIIIFESPQT